MKIKRKLFLKDLRIELYHSKGEDFKVLKIENSTYFKINQVLSKDTIENLICSGEWTVTIKG